LQRLVPVLLVQCNLPDCRLSLRSCQSASHTCPKLQPCERAPSSCAARAGRRRGVLRRLHNRDVARHGHGPRLPPLRGRARRLPALLRQVLHIGPRGGRCAPLAPDECGQPEDVLTCMPAEGHCRGMAWRRTGSCKESDPTRFHCIARRSTQAASCRSAPSGHGSCAVVLCVSSGRRDLVQAGRAWCAGDQAAHLLWRLQHGGTFVRKPPAVAVVMIGTNDLGASACLGGQAAIVRAANGTATRCDASGAERLCYAFMTRGGLCIRTSTEQFHSTHGWHT
jgi:hypothetical protein